MKIIKLLVLLFCAIDVQSYSSGYCDICRNHTLCKYPVGGPTTECKAFDKSALLTNEDIVEIVNRINARRNLVASGRLNRFPQAANMRKMRWSAELAIFAQRWADQCDPFVRPNKEDQCRDLVGLQVGQGIAAVLGPAPGLNVKSFIDMWFMLKLQYTGNVVYYNQSRDDKTNYFTQLIWADTEYLGCGKVKFFNQYVNTVVERLVCNFAPKGNNHGKPVYTVGYPATQCPKFMMPDQEYPALCTQDHITVTEAVQDSSMSSLLRILDSSNNSAKQELDPNNIKQINLNSTEPRVQRNQKTRHAHSNNSNSAIKRDSFHIMQNPLNPISDPDIFKGHQLTPERGHSRMYHGQQTKIESMQNFQSTQPFSDQDFRRFDLSTTSLPFTVHNHDHAPNSRRVNDYTLDGNTVISNQHEHLPDGRKLFSNQNDFAPDNRRNDHVCTRKPKCDDCFLKSCGNECTRGHSCNTCLKTQPCNSCLQVPLPPFSISPLPLPPLIPPQPPLPPMVPLPPLPPSVSMPLPLPNGDLCPCKSSCPLPVPCDYNMKCPICPPSTFCAKRRAQGEPQDSSKSTQFNYYDLFPNIGVRSGEENMPQRKHYESSVNEENLETKSKDSDINKQVKENAVNLKTKFQRPQDLYDIFYSSERKRRDFEDQMTFKPFWQMDEYNNYKRPSELKALRYTTLGNKKNRKTRTTSRLPTESITIKFEDEEIHNDRDKDHITEKYLSFEELMHLRKLSTLEALDYEARRLGVEALRAAATTKKPAATTKKPAATTKKAAPAATTKKAAPAATTKKAAPATTTKKGAPAATTKKPAVTTKAGATTKAAAATTKAAAATTKAVAADEDADETTAITPNTPFVRQKQCTRKLTCTWTAYMLTGQDGKPLLPDGAGGGVIEIGSRTPPGYVDGCTRTSTCTRDFMDRNKVSTTISDEESSEDSTQDAEEGGDYCERRSLNVQRRNLDDTDKILKIEFQEALTEITPSTPEISHVTNRGVADDLGESQYKHSDCVCYEDNSRVKRDKTSKYEELLGEDCTGKKGNKVSNNVDSYDDLYSIFKTSRESNKKPHQCSCNNANTVQKFCKTFYLLALVFYKYAMR